MTRILVIDDEDLVRRAVCLALERAGYEVENASTCTEGVRIFATKGADLVIVDLIMPEQDGFEVIKEIRSRRPQVPILTITGGGPSGPEEMIRRAQEMGVVIALKKPVDRKDLLDAVEAAIEPDSATR